ncbi:MULTISPECIES: PIN domain-containing protein [unclassified Moraxella]|uniref:PIN domain-containing protein n=1 Tax=unclassified Moraxella TaxID=2685852 RepID=UPI003AF61AEC
MTQKSVLVDANILIAMIDGDNTNPNHVEAKQKFNDLIEQNVAIAITPLIRYEVLRGIKSISIDEAQAILDDFVEFNITDKEANPSAKIFHFSRSDDFLAKNTGIKLDKQNFDVFHYVVAKIRHLELVNVNQKDFNKIENVIDLMPNSPFE